MLALCETVECRRRNLLSYFGQPSEPCGNCDTCLDPPEVWDGTIPAQKLLSTIVRLKRERNQEFGAGQLIDILRGKTTPRTTQLSHETIATWGIGADLSEQQWRGVVRQLLAKRLLATRGEYGTLGLTDGSADVLSGGLPVPMRNEPERRASVGAARKAAVADLDPADAGLFEALRAWRAAEAKEQGVPAYIVFGDATLRAIATARPRSSEDLAGISGIGEKKRASYGAALLEVVGAG
jgi:ATP-dependent DNA helicase RecQ